MTWIILEDKNYRHALREIKRQRDRGAGIIACTILQDHLLAAIYTRITPHSDIASKMFKGNGALGDFSTQIDLGFLFDLYTDFVREQLHLIRLIRNDFAHNSQPVSFRSQRSRCELLNPPRQASRVWREKLSREERKKAMKLTSLYHSKNPRTQFLNAVKRYTMHLTMEVIRARHATEWVRSGEAAPRPHSPFPEKYEALSLHLSGSQSRRGNKRSHPPGSSPA